MELAQMDSEPRQSRTLRRGLSPMTNFLADPDNRMGHGTSIRTLWNNQSRWKTRHIPEECLVPTQRHLERRSCILFSG